MRQQEFILIKLHLLHSDKCNGVSNIYRVNNNTVRNELIINEEIMKEKIPHLK